MHNAAQNVVKLLQKIFSKKVAVKGDRAAKRRRGGGWGANGEVGLEVIVVDDASTDGLFKATAPFHDKAEFFYVHQPTSKGAGRARNMAIPLVEVSAVLHFHS